jgi:hypothetical protein
MTLRALSSHAFASRLDNGDYVFEIWGRTKLRMSNDNYLKRTVVLVNTMKARTNNTNSQKHSKTRTNRNLAWRSQGDNNKSICHHSEHSGSLPVNSHDAAI